MRNKYYQNLTLAQVLPSALLAIILVVPGCQGNPPAPAHQELPSSSIEGHIEELGNLDTPKDTAPELWEQLTSKFAEALRDEYTGKDNKLVATAPTSGLSKASLTISDTTLSWGYYNQADYDQNGEVNLADLTSIALNFGLAGPFEVNSVQAIVDGDNNTEINLADITPLVVNFLNSALGGYNIYQSLDPADAPATNSSPNGSTAVFVGNVALSLGTGNTATQRLQFSYDIPVPVVDAYYWVRPTDDELEGTPSNLVRLDPPPNIEPTAVVSVSPDTGEAPLDVVFDGSLSSDPDGTIVDYSWDFDGAVGGFVWVSSGIEPTIEVRYDEPGTYLALLKVTDNDGASINNVVTVIVNAPPGENDPPVADLSANPTSGPGPLTVNFDASLSDDPDGEIVKYEWDWEGDGEYDFIGGVSGFETYEYTIAGDYTATVRVTDNLGATDTASILISVTAGGQQWHTSTIRNMTGVVSISLAQIDGRPAIAYSEPLVDTPINYVQGNDVFGETWADAQEIGHNNTDWLKLVKTDGNPAVIYRYDGGFGGFVRALDPQGDTWDTKVNIEPGFSAFYSTNRWAGAVVGGKPTLGYFGQVAGQDGIFYQSAKSPEGTNWNSPNLVFAADFASYLALGEINGQPAFTFVDSDFALNYVRAKNPGGTDWLPPMLIAEGSYVSMFPEIATVNGNPAILYPSSEDFGNQLKFVRATDADGTAWGSPETLYTNIEFTPGYPALAIIGGNPASAYASANPSDIQYVRANDQNGTSWGTPEFAGDYSYSPISMANINGHPAVAFLRNGFAGDDLMFLIYY